MIRGFQTQFLLTAAQTLNPATSRVWIILETGNSPSHPYPIPGLIFLAPARAPSRTICVLKDSRVLDESHVPCMLHKAPVNTGGQASSQKDSPSAGLGQKTTPVP